MKLLPKKIINTQIADQRKMQIDEGVLVAKKVDALRNNLGKLDKQQKEFIENTKKELDKETKELYKKNEGLKEEIKILESKRLELTKPLTEEWDKLTKVKEIFEREMALLIIQKGEQGKRELVLEEKEQEINDKDIKQTILLKETEQNTEKSRQERDDAERILKEARDKSDEIYRNCDTRLAEIIKEEKKNQFDLEAVRQVEKNNKEKEVELNKRERAINDKYATLERTLNRKTN